MRKNLSVATAVALAICLAGSGAAQIIGVPGASSPAGALNVSGTVTDPSGAPAADVEVGILPSLGTTRSFRTDAQGRYSLQWQPIQMNVGGGAAAQVNFVSSITYSVMARDQSRNLVAIGGINASTTNQDLHLQTGLTLSGNVADPDGKPVPTAQIQLTVITGSLGTPFNRQPIRVDADGTFNLPALPRDMQYGVNVRADGYGSANSQLSAAETGTDKLKLPAFVLRLANLRLANLRLAGQVLDANSQPVPNAQVQVSSTGQPGLIRTDSTGHFELKVTDGPVRLIAIVTAAGANSQIGSVAAQGGDTNVVIRLGQNPGTAAVQTGRPVTITGVVTDSTGNPVAGIHISTVPQRVVGNADIRTDNEGRYSLTTQPLPAGAAASLSILARDPVHNLAALADINERTTTKDLRLVPGLTLSGTVQDESGAALSTANLLLNVFSGNNLPTLDRQPTRVDSQGAFQIAALPQGLRYSLTVRAPDHGSVARALSASDTQTSELKLPPIVLNTANLVVAGRVLDAGDKPISGAQVQCGGTGQPTTVARTDSRGHFEFKVCDGRVQLIASAPNGPAAVVQAQSGDTTVVIHLTTNPTTLTTLANGLRQIISGSPLNLRSGRVKPPLMSWDYFKLWPSLHKTAVYSIAACQLLVLAVLSAGIFWATRRGRA